MRFNFLILVIILFIIFLPFNSSASVIYTGTSWDTATSGNTDPHGITMNTTYFWISDADDDEVYQYYSNGTYTGVSWDTAASGSNNPTGITMNTTYFWISDFGNAEVYQYYHNGTYTGTSWDTATSGNTFPFDIAMNTTYFWVTDYYSSLIYQYYHNGTYTGTSWDTSLSGNTGITMNTTYFWVVNVGNDEVYQYYHNGTYTGTSWDTSLSGNIDPTGIIMNTSFFWVIDTGDDEVYQYSLITIPPLLSPSNASTIYTTYPPLTSIITFSWEDIIEPQYRLMIAEDVNFNVMTVDTHIGTNNSNQNLLVNKEYWWKVYSYDGTTYSDSSGVYSFNLTGNSTLSGSAIEGVVYADIDGTYTALSGAEVIIWNATWTDTAITGSNGYYVFTGVASGEVYSVQAKKDLYLDSSVALVNATANPITQDFYLLPDRTSEEWRHYVKFTVQNIWGTKYSNVDVTVYENDDVSSLYTATTGSDGSATFILNRQQEYRITFINSTLGISETRTLYPKDTHYYIIVSSTLGSWDTYTVPISDAIDFTITKSIINSTHAYINVSYNDSQVETTDLKVYLNQTNESDYFNQTNLDTWNAGANSSGSHSFVVENYAGQSYIIRLLAEHTTYGTIDSTYSVSFKDDIATKFPGIPPSAFLYSSIFILLFTGGIFVKTNVEKGMLVICIMFFIFYGLGAFNTLPSNVQQSMLAGAILGFILSVIANLNKSNREEGFS